MELGVSGQGLVISADWQNSVCCRVQAFWGGRTGQDCPSQAQSRLVKPSKKIKTHRGAKTGYVQYRQILPITAYYRSIPANTA
jgi:hypothetical protein